MNFCSRSRGRVLNLAKVGFENVFERMFLIFVSQRIYLFILSFSFEYCEYIVSFIYKSFV